MFHGMKTKRANRRQSRTAFTFVELLVVIAILTLVIALLLPVLATSKRPSPHSKCTNNLKQVGLAFRLWAEDHNGKYPMQVSIANGGAMEWEEAGSVWPVFMVLSNELSTPKILFCPQDAGTNRVQTTAFWPAPYRVSNQNDYFRSDNNVSYFIGMEADEVHPERILAGDSNLELNQKTVARGFLNLWTNAPVRWDKTRHEKQCGNIALADGSVQNCTKAQLQKLLAETLIQTNRLLIP